VVVSRRASTTSTDRILFGPDTVGGGTGGVERTRAAASSSAQHTISWVTSESSHLARNVNGRFCVEENSFVKDTISSTESSGFYNDSATSTSNGTPAASSDHIMA
ncbi:unnamed protein product, partial [Amoebophrya sp. A120]